MQRIALEEHFVINSPEHIERWLSTATILPKEAVETMTPVITDLGDARLEAMDKAGVSMAVLSNAGSVQGMLDASPALRLAKEANDHLAAVVTRRPDRYAGFATTPLQDPVAGADELERAVKQLGLKGAMLFGHTNGVYLDDPRFDPFWERAEALNVPIYLHASDPEVLPRTYFGCEMLQGPVWSWTSETSAHVLRMIFNGVFERYPRLRLVLGHMGEALPFMLWRLDRRTAAFAKSGSHLTPPSEVLKRNVFVTSAGVFADAPLTCAMDALGEDHVMFSVDYPFESMDDASAWLDRSAVSENLRNAISFRNAQKLLGIDDQVRLD